MNKLLSCLMVLLCAMTLAGCRHRASMPELEGIDSLLARHQDSLALVEMQHVDANCLNDGERAYYALLLTQARYKNYIEQTSDSLIRVAAEYYAHHDDTEKRTRSLIYYGCVNEELGKLDAAVVHYHEAEATADAKDLYNLAFAKMRLAYLYHCQIIGSKTIALDKYQSALHLFRAIGDQHYELICLTEIGNIYRNIDEKQDSALVVMSEAIDLSRELNDRYFLFANLFNLSEFYSVRKHDYDSAKSLAIEALSAGGALIDHPRAHYRLAQDYLELGQSDSAQYYIRHAPPPVSAADSILYYSVMSELEHKLGHDAASHTLYLKADAIDDSVLVAGLNHRLLNVEKQYDTQRVELENSKLQSQRLRLWLYLLIALTTAIIMIGLVIRYRKTLKEKELQYNSIKSQLSSTLIRLKEISADIDGYKTKLHVAQQSIDALHRDIDHERRQFTIKDQQSNDLRNAVKEQIRMVEQLINWSETMTAEKFVSRFAQMMTLPRGKAKVRAKSRETILPEFWRHLHTLANGLHNDVLVRAQQTTGGALRDDEINYLALFSCGFNPMVIMACLGYENVGTLHNKRSKLSKVLQVEDLWDFVDRQR